MALEQNDNLYDWISYYDTHKEAITKEDSYPSLPLSLIHIYTCCAPCSSAIIECLMQHVVTPVIYYCNPNIYPLEEYSIRKDECTRYAQSLGLEMIDADYDHDAWRCRMTNELRTELFIP